MNNIDNLPSNDNSSSNHIPINTGAIDSPFVVFFGPMESGKTVGLIRLAKFLEININASVKVNESFRYDNNYQKVIESFQAAMADPSSTPGRTQQMNFLLTDIYVKTKKWAQFLEAPGEDFFSQTAPEMNTRWKPYLNQIMAMNRRKTIIVFFEKNMLTTPAQRQAYAQRVISFINLCDFKKDKLILLYNKVDNSPEIFMNGRVSSEAIKQNLIQNPDYKALFQAIKNNRFIKKIGYLPFSSGAFYHDANTNKESMTMGNDNYPKALWHQIEQAIRPKKWWIF